MPVQEQSTPRQRESVMSSSAVTDHAVWVYMASPTHDTPPPNSIPFTLAPSDEPSSSLRPPSPFPAPSLLPKPTHTPITTPKVDGEYRNLKHPNRKQPRKAASSQSIGNIARNYHHELNEVKALLRATQEKLDRETRRADLADARCTLAQDRASEALSKTLSVETARREAESEVHHHKAMLQTRNEEVSRLERRLRESEGREAVSRDKAHETRLALVQAGEHHKGYVEGHQSGMRIRIQKERKVAFEQGHERGYEEGRDHGYDEGRNHGFEEGKRAGVVEGKKTGRKEAKGHALKAFDDFLTSDTVGGREGKEGRTRAWAQSVYFHDLEEMPEIQTIYSRPVSQSTE